MNNQEAIKGLKNLFSEHELTLPCTDSLEILHMAVSALEKQTPKKPNIIIDQTDADKLACCPTCDSNLDWTYEGFWRNGKRKYCHECGQAIDWRE